MPRKLPLYLTALQTLTAAAILPRALRRAAAQRVLSGQPALTPNEATVLCGLHVLCTANRGGIRVRELRAARLVGANGLGDAITTLVGAGLITRSRRVKVELVLYSVTAKGSVVVQTLTDAIQHEARELWHVLAGDVVRAKPRDKRYRYRPARRVTPSPTPLSKKEGGEPTPTPTR